MLAFGVPGSYAWIFGLPWLGLLFTAGMLIQTYRSWQGKWWSRLHRLHGICSIYLYMGSLEIGGDDQMNYKLQGSTGFIISLFAILLFCASSSAVAPDKTDFILHISVMIGGVAIGWIIGMLASPYGREEKEQFSTIVKGVTVFFSGYVLAKIDPIITTLLKPEAFLKPVAAFRAIAFVPRFYWPC